MKILFFILLICSVFTTTSCSKPKDAKNKSTETSKNITANEEDFDSFLENFNNKPTFQRQRVLFPLEATLLDPSEYGMQTVNEKLEYKDWILLDFSYDSTFATRQMDRYEQRIRLYNDSSIIEHRGIDNGIFANFFFIKKEGKWFLKSFTDTSY
jgi:hypothetical protein